MRPNLFWRAIIIIFFLTSSLLPANLIASDLGPTASFYITPSSGSLETTFSFDASASYDQKGFSNSLSYRWNFDYNTGGSFSEWSLHPTTTHKFTSSGEKTIALEVKDNNEAIDRTFGTITVAETKIFDGWFDISPKEGDLNTVFEYQAIITSKSSVPISDYQVRWDFNGDNIFDTDFSTSKINHHTYSTTGYYNPKMEIKSPDGTTLIIIGYEDNNENLVSYIYVTFDQYPQASISVYPSIGSTSTLFYFDGSTSFDSQDHKNIKYRWDFEGDGLFDLDWSDEINPTHYYLTPRTYNAILQIKDQDGYIDEAFTTIIVQENNFPPKADFSINSDSGLSDKTLGTTSTNFTFNASSSKDEEDSLSQLQARWDFNGDQNFDTSYDTLKTANYRYLDPGTYSVTLEIMDTNGQKDIITKTITIVANDAPNPAFTVSPLRGTTGTIFSFDASATNDSQYTNSSLEIRWDWDGDGNYDTPFNVDKTTKYQYELAGNYQVIMQVRDPEGKTLTTSQTIEVIASAAPTANLKVDFTEGTFSTAFHFDASQSSDGETKTEDLKFRWDYNYTGTSDITYDTSWSTGKTKTLYFDQTGDIKIRVEVKDSEGYTASAFLTVHLHWASAYMDYLKNKGILKGYANGDMAPDQFITRAELLKMALKSAEISEAGHIYQSYFSDVKQMDWFYSYVEKAYEIGIVSGYSNGYFYPNNPITRAEATKIIIKSFSLELINYKNGTFTDVSSNDWFANYVATAYDYGLINGYGDGTFQPYGQMTRGEASKILALALQGNL